MASLLEVGTGFHPELTGRENIYLNGAILGMTREEIERKFDEIVAFAEVEKFLDTPVKRYSSGMYVRLAFAVAAHLEPEILVVDEVLAVGDGAFQKKCLGKWERSPAGAERSSSSATTWERSPRSVPGRCSSIRAGWWNKGPRTRSSPRTSIEAWSRRVKSSGSPNRRRPGPKLSGSTQYGSCRVATSRLTSTSTKRCG